jgi:glycosyltransferase involved in cell wall biosynthesis
MGIDDLRGGHVSSVRVLQVIPSIGPLRGGPSFVIRTMSVALAARGCEVDVATTDDNGSERLAVPLDRPVREDGVTYRYFRRQMFFYTVSWPLFRWLRKNVASYDVLHIHALFSFSVAAAAWWASYYRVPYVVRPLGTLNRWGMENRRPWLKQASLRLIDRRVLSGAAAVHFTSEEEREEGALVASDLHPVIIPNPVDFQFDRERLPAGWLRSRYPAIAGKKIILFLSRLHPTKGIDLLLAAFARVRVQVPNVALVLGGAGDEEFVQQLYRQARELGLESDIVWAGFLEGDCKKAAMAEADLFVLPSYSESFGVAAVEAMAAGLPVIVSDRVGIHREIGAARAGLVIPCQAEALAAALQRLLDAPALRGELALNAKKLAESYYPARITERLLELYSQITRPLNGQPLLASQRPTAP